MKYKLLLFLLCVTLLSCSDDEGSTTVTTDPDPDPDPDPVETPIIDSDYFNTSSFTSITTVTCTLEDGTETECYQIVFTGDAIDGEAGPYCPATINEIGGLSLYDGNTNPGLRNISKDFLNDLETDGWNIVDANNDVFVRYTSEQFPPNSDTSYCLQLPYDPDLTFTYTIPTSPIAATSAVTLDEFDRIGLTLDGTSIIAEVPSAVYGPSGNLSQQINFPSLDPCGGHPDNSGDYHLHFIPQVMNQILSENSITDVSCTLFNQVSDVTLVGFALDGYPIYAYAEIPNDLDDCHGRTAVTTEYPNGIYHYVATTDLPNVPPCRKGLASERPYSVR